MRLVTGDLPRIRCTAIGSHAPWKRQRFEAADPDAFDAVLEGDDSDAFDGVDMGSDDSEEELDNPEPVIDATTTQAAAAPGLAQLLTQQGNIK